MKKALSLLVTLALLGGPLTLFAAPQAKGRVRIMPPDAATFLVDQRFDLRAEAPPGNKNRLRVLLDGRDISEWDGRSKLTGGPIDRAPAPALAGGAAFISRDWSFPRPGKHTLRAECEGAEPAEVSFEVVAWEGAGGGAKNVILLIGDGLGVAHRTAARVASRGVVEGKYRGGMLEMDTLPVVGLVTTSSLSAVVTDSSPGASCYSTGNKAANNEEGVFPDNTDNEALKVSDPESDRFMDNPRVEYVGEFLRRKRGMNLGIVTTASVTDATPAAFAVHTSNRNAGTRIADDFFERRDSTGLTVLLGGGRQWFTPKVAGQPGRRATPTNAKVNPARDLVAEFRAAGFAYADNADALRRAAAEKPQKLLGLFAAENMPVAFDKLGYGAERAMNVPMLDEMARVALDVMRANSPRGFFLMIEGASIDKQAHRMDAERSIWDTIEFDKAVGVARRFAEATNTDADPNNDTLVVVTADHETAGFSIIGARNPDPRIPRGSRDAARAYEGFTDYKDANKDGYPDDPDTPSKLIIGYGAGVDRYEDWHSNARPGYPGAVDIKTGRAVANARRDGPEDADAASRRGTLITGHVENGELRAAHPGLDVEARIEAVHTASDIPLSAYGPGAMQFIGVQDNTAVFFKMMRALGGLFPRVYRDGGAAGPRRAK
jgi:alkaline phosphatase